MTEELALEGSHEIRFKGDEIYAVVPNLFLYESSELTSVDHLDFAISLKFSCRLKDVASRLLELTIHPFEYLQTARKKNFVPTSANIVI